MAFNLDPSIFVSYTSDSYSGNKMPSPFPSSVVKLLREHGLWNTQVGAWQDEGTDIAQVTQMLNSGERFGIGREGRRLCVNVEKGVVRGSPGGGWKEHLLLIFCPDSLPPCSSGGCARGSSGHPLTAGVGWEPAGCMGEIGA